MYEYETASGTIQVLYTMTLGDIAIVTVVSILVITQLLHWFYEMLWGGGRK